MNVNEIFGRLGGDYFVNSADGIPMDRVEEIFPTARANGSVPSEKFHGLTDRDGKLILIEDLIVGHVAIRKYIESIGVELRGGPYTKRQANNLLRGADFICKLKGKNGATMDYTSRSSLHAYVEKKHIEGQEKHRNSLKAARSAKKDRG